MSQAKTKYLVHPLLGKSESSLPWEIYSAFLVAQVEIDHACTCLDNIKLTMDDLKKAWDAGVRSSSDGDETEATERRKFKKREKGKVP